MSVNDMILNFFLWDLLFRTKFLGSTLEVKQLRGKVSIRDEWLALPAPVLTFSSLNHMPAFITSQSTRWRYKYVTLQK